MKKTLLLLLVLGPLTSCFLNNEKGPLYLTDKIKGSNELTTDSAVYELRRKIRLLEEKGLEWKEIQEEAQTSFKSIKNIVQKKCYDCHDSDTKLAFYGRLFRRINPINRHQEEGLEAFDFVSKFPLKSRGSENQLSLLNAFRNSVVDKTMPLKSYTLFYPFRKIKKKDQAALLEWIDPLIERLKGFEEKYSEIIIDPTPAGMAKRIFSEKCFRCHANGSSKGGFGEMQNLEALKISKFINLDKPTQSELYTISLSHEMPPNLKEALTEEELESMLLWIQN